MQPFPSILRPVNLIVRKWILVLSIIVNISYLALIIHFSGQIISKCLQLYGTKLGLEENDDYVKQISTTWLIAICSSLVLFELLLLLGLLRESHCLSVTYSIKLILTTAVFLLLSTLHAVFLVHSLWAAFITIISLFYVHDLKSLRLLALKRMSTISWKS